ncbi:glycoside hydrolase family 2 protein [Melanomma pulvis-pyrius CBS 109.77]|uniref:Glycoside hydrolase family 2 protein n=1 Tax=Melanomma pulvis-pyrius CBS 109.77 TaxID=1314802 RepID=A0A6A6XUV0_9PLEO|nr:glycoside hydrolase family 2 protein [Melanomma pulvis-pyrius CBS 109.77]
MRFSIAFVSWLLPATALATSNSRVLKRANDTDYVLKKGPLDTPWTEKVGTNPWPEYPRPQLQRSDWKNLNGVWRYKNASAGDDKSPPSGVVLPEPVLVPFCLESALSGVMGSHNIWSWYQTTFDVPSSWTAGNRVILNFGAVDYEATVFINGNQTTFHRGGYWSFNVDVTDYLSANGTNELLVFVYDPTDKDNIQIPLGKQTLDPSHIFYTPCSGIWQTVWLESTPVEHVTQLDLSADMNGEVNMTVHTSSNSSTLVQITIYEPHSTDIKATARGRTNGAFQFNVESPKLWSPSSPTLYNITVKVGSDTIQSYIGFRTISHGVINGVNRPLLNGEFIFLFGTLDQGFWPDGIYTPPSREAMIFDLQTLKNVGYNMLRKHIKVETALFYQACDELGLMLIQDMPSLRPSVPVGPALGDCQVKTQPVANAESQAEFDRQLAILIEQHKSYPSIITWVIYNEGWGQAHDRTHPEFQLTDLVRSLDPTRLIDSVTGWFDFGAGDFHDNHHYPDPQCGTPWYSIQSTPYDYKRIAFQGEFGGIGHNVSEDHLWKVQKAINEINGTYEIDANLDVWNERAHFLLSELRGQIEKYDCSGAVWTQTTDVEGEVNGMLTYDRRLNRMDQVQWKRDIQALYDTAAARAANSTTVMQMADTLEGL